MLSMLTMCLILSVKNQTLTFLFHHLLSLLSESCKHAQASSSDAAVSCQPTYHHLLFLVAYWILSRVKTALQVDASFLPFLRLAIIFCAAFYCFKCGNSPSFDGSHLLFTAPVNSFCIEWYSVSRVVLLAGEIFQSILKIAVYV